MPEIFSAGPARRRHGKPAAGMLRSAKGLRARLRLIAALPVLPAGAALAYPAAVHGHTAFPTGAGWLVWGGAATAAGAMAGASWHLASRTAQAVQQQREDDAAVAAEAADRMVARLAEGLKQVQGAIEQSRRGERTEPIAPPAPSSGVGPLAVVERELDAFVSEVRASITDASIQLEHAALLVIGRRMLTMVTAMLKDFDALERDLEYPEVLMPIFHLDHLATRLRRLAESVALVGGAIPRRSARPTPLGDLLHHAVSEIERYDRVNVVDSVRGSIRGDAASSLILLLAELIDNATAYSPPSTAVDVRVECLDAGVVITIDDRGRPMDPQVRSKLNALLADPDPRAPDLLRQGQLGLWAVAKIARQLGLNVRLQSNHFLATQAAVFVPRRLFETDAPPQPRQPLVVASAPSPDAVAGPVPWAAEEAVTEQAPRTSRAEQPVPAGGQSLPTRRRGDALRAVQASEPSAIAPQPAGPEGGAVPLPTRDPTRSYLAPQLRRPKVAAEPDRGAAPAPDAGLVARISAGRRRAEDQT